MKKSSEIYKNGNREATDDHSVQWPWPDSLDAVVAAPKSHRIFIENEQVRVLEVMIEPGEKEPPHTHRWPSVMIVDRRSRIRYYSEEDKLVYETPMNSEAPENLEPRWMDPEGLHAVENIDSKPLHAIRIEIKEKK
jgi:hypothetical protein